MLEDLIMKQSQPKNLHLVVDRDETIPGALLMYANYASVDETLRAQQRLEHWLDHNWEWNNRPLVAVKSAQQEVYFGMHVSGLPGDATTSDVEVFFSQFGSFSHVLHHCNDPLTILVNGSLQCTTTRNT